MDSILIGSKNSIRNGSELKHYLRKKVKLQDNQTALALIFYTWKNIKSEYDNNQFSIQIKEGYTTHK